MEAEEAVTPCSLALLGLQMGKALRRMTQNGAQLLLVSIRRYTHAVCSKGKHTTRCTHKLQNINILQYLKNAKMLILSSS